MENSKEEETKLLKEKLKQFECKICMDTGKESVVTQCGHLYCWQCIYNWSCHKESKKIPCPICKNSLDIDKLIPLYTSVSNHKERTDKLPKRPRPERNEHQERTTNNNNNRSYNASFYINGIPIYLSNGNWRRNIPSLLICIGFIAISFLGEFFVWGSSNAYDMLDILENNPRRSYNNQRRYTNQNRNRNRRSHSSSNRNQRRRTRRTSSSSSYETLGSLLYTIFTIAIIGFAFYYNKVYLRNLQQRQNRTGQRP